MGIFSTPASFFCCFHDDAALLVLCTTSPRHHHHHHNTYKMIYWIVKYHDMISYEMIQHTTASSFLFIFGPKRENITIVLVDLGNRRFYLYFEDPMQHVWTLNIEHIQKKVFCEVICLSLTLNETPLII